jgi:hypothetical protein
VGINRRIKRRIALTSIYVNLVYFDPVLCFLKY